MRLPLLCAASLSALLAGGAHAQAIRGVVVDSASRQPVPGVVVSLLDASSTLLGRIVTNHRGQFNVPSASRIARLRAQRIGFRLRELPIAVAPSGFTDVEVRITSLPTMLDPVRVVANTRCPRRDDRAASYALLEQARAGLLAAVVAGSEKPGIMRGLAFARYIGRTDDRVDSQSVRIDSAFTRVSFGAARTPAEFITTGFVRATSNNSQEYFGPDAGVLLSQEFSSTYCFRLAAREKDRANQAGLAFQPAERLRNGNAIAGVLWIDTVSRSLVELEFRYLDLGRVADMVRPGGWASFLEIRPGIVLIDRWHLRLPRYRADTSRNIHNANVIVPWTEPVETGAELAMVRWDDGAEWRGRLGTLRVVAREGELPVPGLSLGLDNTDYRGMTDSLGRLELGELLPGPYALTAISAELAEVGLSFPVSLRFVAERDSIFNAVIQAPTLESYAFKQCVTDRRMRADASRHHLVAGRVVRPDGSPVEGAEIKAKWLAASDYFLNGVKSTESGHFAVCIPERQRNETFTVVVRGESFEEKIVSVTAKAVVTPLRVTVGRP